MRFDSSWDPDDARESSSDQALIVPNPLGPPVASGAFSIRPQFPSDEERRSSKKGTIVPRIRFILTLWFCLSVVGALARETTPDAFIDELLDLDEQQKQEQRNVEFDEVILEMEEEEEPSSTDDATESVEKQVGNEEKPLGIKVKTNLEALSVAELESICLERGFALEGDNLQHADYIEASRRCLSLEDEMNAIIAENFDLAAELEAEIEHMAREKERLETERDAMLAEVEALQEQLKAAGRDPLNIPAKSSTTGLSATVSSPDLPYDPSSSIAVFRHSFRLLWTRVGADVRLEGKLLRIIVLRPSFRLVWRYAGPTVEQCFKKVTVLTDPIFEVEQRKAQSRNICGWCRDYSKGMEFRL